jgi:hypothetical protein
MLRETSSYRRNNSGSLAMMTAMRRASSRLGSFAAETYEMKDAANQAASKREAPECECRGFGNAAGCATYSSC